MRASAWYRKGIKRLSPIHIGAALLMVAIVIGIAIGTEAIEMLNTAISLSVAAI
jgi:hypothetical protein